MKNLCALLVITLAHHANAGCQDIATYRDKTIAIDISDGGCRTSTKISVAPIKNGEANWEGATEFEFYDECTYSKDRKFFTCKNTVGNPLSGATYKRVRKGYEKCGNPGEKYPAYVYRCIKNCKKAPHVMPASYGCD